MAPCPENYEATARRDTIAREVAAWHAAHPVAEPHVIKDGKANRPGSGLYGRLTGEELQAARETAPETRARAETCNCGHEKVAHADAGHGACTAVLGEDARCVCRGYSRSDAIPETLTREEAIVAASHLSPAASSMIDLTDPRACLRSFESLRSAPPDFWKARDIVVAYVAHLDRLAAASPEQIAKDHAVGLYRKFDVRRTDGSSDPGGKHEACEYFVLDWQHDPFTVPAVRAYADACEATYPALAADLRAKAEIIAAAPGQTPVAPRDVVGEALAAMVAFFGFLFTRKRPDTDPSRAIDLGVAAADQVDITHPWSGIPVRTLRDLVTLAAEEHAEIRRLASERLTRVAKVRRERKAADRAAGRVTEEDLAAAERCANSLRSVAAYHARVNFGGADGETHARSQTAAENAAELLSSLAAEVRALRAERRSFVPRSHAVSLYTEMAEANAEAERLRGELAADASEEARRESPIELLAREFDRAAHMQGSGLIDHDRGDCYRDAAKRMRAVDRPGLTEEQARAWATLYSRAAEFMAMYPANYSDEEIAMRDALRAVDDARASRSEAPPAVAGHDANEGLGPEPGILAPAASEPVSPSRTGHVSIPRAILERLVDATLRDESVREAVRLRSTSSIRISSDTSPPEQTPRRPAPPHRS
jgi:hypothetical protein